MFNDLVLSKNDKQMVAAQGGLTASAGGDPLLDGHRWSIDKLAAVMSRLPNSVFVGPGSARLWAMDEHFDRGSEKMLNTLDLYGITHINANELIGTMEKRDQWHFRDTVHNKTTICRILGTAISITDMK